MYVFANVRTLPKTTPHAERGETPVKKGTLTEAARVCAFDGALFFAPDAEKRKSFAGALAHVTELESGAPETELTPTPGRRVGIEGGTNIGGLGERTLHLILKYMAEPDKSFHEVKCGRFFADIKRNGEITEVQTRNFRAMRKKLEAFTSAQDGEEPLKVTVVHPIAESKTLIWVDPESGELSGFRKSPKHESIYGAFREIYALGDLLGRKNLSFVFPVLACDEYKLKCGRSRDGKRFGAARLNRIPTEYLGEYRFADGSDFARLLPEELRSEKITVKKAAALLGLDARLAHSFLRSLCFAGCMRKCGKDGGGRADLYMYDNGTENEPKATEDER